MGPNQRILIGTKIRLGKYLTQTMMWAARIMGIVPRCLCMGYPGIPMYFSRLPFKLWLTIKCNPGTGPLHAASCPSYRLGYGRSHGSSRPSRSGSLWPALSVPAASIRRALPIPLHTVAFLEGLYAVFAIAYAVVRFPAKW
jgi:hypothetical protein